MDSLDKLDRHTRSILAHNNETLWLYSNPPHFDSEDEIRIADFSGDEYLKRAYREELEKKYGKRLMLFSGIHFNFSFSDELLNELWEKSGQKIFSVFKNELYLKLYKQLMMHSFLLVMLTASSPYYDRSLDGNGIEGVSLSEYALLRNSERGYWNKFVPVLDHSSLEAFVKSIEGYIDRGELYSASELYLPVRLKPRGNNSLEEMYKSGVDHIELRMFDLNPAFRSGIDKKDLRFAHLLILYLLSVPDTEFNSEQQIQAISNYKNAAQLYPDQILISRGMSVLDAMEDYFESISDAADIIAYERDKLIHINERSAERINVYDNETWRGKFVKQLVEVHYIVKPGKRLEFYDMLIKSGIANASRAEEGNEKYDYCFLRSGAMRKLFSFTEKHSILKNSLILKSSM